MFYICFGITISSEINLPLINATETKSIDLTVTVGKIDISLEALIPCGLGLHYNTDNIVLTLQNIARYSITRAAIVIKPAEHSDELSIKNFLISGTMAKE